MREQTFEEFDQDRGVRMLRAAFPYVVVAALLLAIAWFVYDRMTSITGVKVSAPSPQAIEMLPPPPPPPPPPPEEVKPPEPTEKPEPAPVTEAPKTPEQLEAPTPMTMNAPAQPGPSPFNVASGAGTGSGSPSGSGTCLIPPCGTGKSSGEGMGLGLYDRYLRSELQQRVQRDDRVNREVFSADFLVSVSSGGAVTSVRLVRSSGSASRDQMLAGILQQVRGLQLPPDAMAFPRKINVRGRAL